LSRWPIYRAPRVVPGDSNQALSPCWPNETNTRTKQWENYILQWRFDPACRPMLHLNQRTGKRRLHIFDEVLHFLNPISYVL
jgi:hypothetical protein